MASRISSIAPFLLITLLCLGGVEAFYYAVERYVLTPPREKAATVQEEKRVEERAAVKRAPRAVDHGVIVRRNLFGGEVTPVAPEQGDAEPEELPEATSLAIVLMGTVHGADGEERAIILNKKDRKQEMYKVGDSVQGAVIKEIRRGKVVLSVNGQDESLDMSEASKYGSARPSAPVAAVSPRRRPVTTELPDQGEEAEMGRQVQPRVVRPKRSIVRSPQRQDMLPAEVEPEDVEELQEVFEDQDMLEPEESAETAE